MVQGSFKKKGAVAHQSNKNKPGKKSKSQAQKIIAKQDAKIKFKMEDRVASIAHAAGDGAKLKIIKASDRGLSDLEKRKGGKGRTPTK
jgi:hypothetical protein